MSMKVESIKAESADATPNFATVFFENYSGSETSQKMKNSQSLFSR